MRFKRLEIWEMDTYNSHARTHVFEDVDIRYENGRTTATREDGTLVAELGTYDDDPVTINGASEHGGPSGAIIIDGLAVTPAPSLKHEYAFWKLT